MPAIAVVMPVYNRARNVRAAIDSVLAQDFTDFELIIVDDGSSDGTADVIEAAPVGRIRYLRQSGNLGGNAARNRGIREAVSPLICFIDSDDRFLPHKLGFLVGYFDCNPDVDVLIDSYHLVYPPETGKHRVDRINPDLTCSASVEQAIFARKVYKATPALSARRETLCAAGMFDESLTRRQDMDLVLRLTKTAHCVATSQILWSKFWSADSISARQETFAIAVIEMCERHPDYLARPEFRVGLARDVARHFFRLASKGRLTTARADFMRFARFFGYATLSRLFLSGTVEILRRATVRGVSSGHSNSRQAAPALPTVNPGKS